MFVGNARKCYGEDWWVEGSEGPVLSTHVIAPSPSVATPLRGMFVPSRYASHSPVVLTHIAGFCFNSATTYTRDREREKERVETLLYTCIHMRSFLNVSRTGVGVRCVTVPQ
ncbi:hypothetical protein, unlikely [Trypanosoma brucei gambiense DAL972]|uniref:Uncharacterized protein n=1 Tax=Trypanosoma brucei gambiense (strain MHOM/CI/86/DAL972) TaxID=679716 RepID=C9ZRV0_TRYB9|nr:hypothetical protein, unlikely [Trypanosoma brucei gambiense DAL972]CBH12086.1 hypothetical protein, unlikely [Trypanosoma brucei gambiense DAL972]|eukprot:XP_011774369.1 hypothetical protein, unlikely [Trypanosoma brucei gambiense DAL972]